MPHKAGAGVTHAWHVGAVQFTGGACAFKAALVVVKAPGGRIPGATHVHHVVGRVNQRLFAGADQGV